MIFLLRSGRATFDEIIHLRHAAMFHLSVELEPSVFLRCADPRMLGSDSVPTAFLLLFFSHHFPSAYPYLF